MSRDQLNLLAFVVGLFIAAALLLPGAVWATTVIPDVPGYTSTSAGYTPSQGTLNGWQGQYNTAAKSYPVTGKITLMSKAISVPGKATLLADAGNLAKAAMRLHPGKLAGTLAAGWLLDQGMQYLNGEWSKESPVENPSMSLGTCSREPSPVTLAQCGQQAADFYAGSWSFVEALWMSGTQWSITIRDDSSGQVFTGQGSWIGTPECSAGSELDNRGQCVGSQSVPANDSDWAGLPDPVPTVGPELPTAGYMPQGAPVSAPTYDFVPFNAPTGSPYKKPDGSTWQDGATVSPVINNTTNNYNNVKVVNYSTKVTNADGSPVPVPVPEEKPDDESDPCAQNPDRAGCAKLGEFEHEIPKKEHVFEFESEDVNMVGQCPAAIPILGHALSFQPACDAMGMIKPLVVGMAAVLASMILFGGMRGAD